MPTRYDNPIFKRLSNLRPTDRAPRAPMVAMSLLGVSVGGLLLVALLDYPKTLIDALALTLPLGAGMLMLMLITVLLGILRREVVAQSFDLLFLTNIRTSRFVWGTLMGLLWRIRLWGMLYVWTTMMAGLTVSAWLYDRSAPESGFRLAALSFPFHVPRPETSLVYATAWGIFGLCSLIAILGQVAAAGFQRRVQLQSLAHAVATLITIHVVLGPMLVVVLALTRSSLIWAMLMSSGWFGCLYAIGHALTRRWHFDGGIMWYPYSQSLMMIMMVVIVAGYTGVPFLVIGAIYLIGGPLSTGIVVLGVLLLGGGVRVVTFIGFLRRNPNSYFGLSAALVLSSHVIVVASLIVPVITGLWLAWAVSWGLLGVWFTLFGTGISAVNGAWNHVWPDEYLYIPEMWFTDYSRRRYPFSQPLAPERPPHDPTL